MLGKQLFSEAVSLLQQCVISILAPKATLFCFITEDLNFIVIS